jgi:hypothetical protein
MLTSIPSSGVLFLFLVTSEVYFDQFYIELKSSYSHLFNISVLAYIFGGGLLKRLNLPTVFSKGEDFMIDSVLTVFLVKLLFFLIPSSARVILGALSGSVLVSRTLLGLLLKSIDAAPLWLLVASASHVLPKLSDVSLAYVKAWFWLTLWLVGGYAFALFALLSGVAGLLFRFN